MISHEGRSETGALSLFIVVPGTPQSKGSRVQVGEGQNIEAGTKNSRKRKRAHARSVETYVRHAIATSSLPRSTFPLDQPVRVDAWFYFPIARTRMRGKYRIDPGSEHDHKPDRDKCNRQIGDAIKNGGATIDDCKDSKGWSEKLWCLAGEERTEIRIIWKEGAHARPRSRQTKRPSLPRKKQSRGPVQARQKARPSNARAHVRCVLCEAES